MHRLLLEFRHGLGDAAQFTIVLRHLKHFYPDWQTDLAALHGKHPIGRELCRNVYVLGRQPGRSNYDQVVSLEWHECRNAHTQWPSTKATRCLQEVFHLTPVLELCRYQIARSSAADQQAREYLAEICARASSVGRISNPSVTELISNGLEIRSTEDAKHLFQQAANSDGRYPVVLLHYQGNTSCDRKDLTHDLARQICDTVLGLGYVPVILDWDNRSPLVDQQQVFNPGAEDPLWGGYGTGDAEILASLIEASSLMIGVDSGPLHVAGATTTPTLGVWTYHHPVHYFDLASNVVHLVPRNHQSLAIGPAAVEFFEQHYAHEVYDDLAEAVVAQVRSALTHCDASPVERISNPFVPITASAEIGASQSVERVAAAAGRSRSHSPTRPQRSCGGSEPKRPAARTLRRGHRPAGAANGLEIRSTRTAPAKPERILTSTLYDRQYYEEHLRTGLDYLTFGDWQRDYGRWFVDSLNLRGRRILDVGCACGSILRGLIEAGAVGEGFDLSDYMIQLGRRKWPDMSPRLHVADACDLSRFTNASWDAIHSSQVAEHWPPEAVPAILRELARITVPGGLFFCALDTEELFARQGRTQETEDPTHICIRPRAWWIEQLESNGWHDATAEFEQVLKSHPLSYLRRYDWDWWVGKKKEIGD